MMTSRKILCVSETIDIIWRTCTTQITYNKHIYLYIYTYTPLSSEHMINMIYRTNSSDLAPRDKREGSSVPSGVL